MAGFDIVALQDRIVEEVETLLPNTLIFEDSIDDDADIPIDTNNKVIPYIVLRFGPLRPSYTGKSMRGPRHDEYWASCDVVAIGPKGRTARLLLAGVVDHLIGFKPDGISPMSMRTDAGDPAQFVVSSNESRPTQFVASTRLRYTVNSVGVGSHVP
jgi:hypothetical protein